LEFLRQTLCLASIHIAWVPSCFFSASGQTPARQDWELVPSKVLTTAGASLLTCTKKSQLRQPGASNCSQLIPLLGLPLFITLLTPVDPLLTKNKLESWSSHPETMDYRIYLIHKYIGYTAFIPLSLIFAWICKKSSPLRL
jgi:hypothetical protein